MASSLPQMKRGSMSPAGVTRERKGSVGGMAKVHENFNRLVPQKLGKAERLYKTPEGSPSQPASEVGYVPPRPPLPPRRRPVKVSGVSSGAEDPGPSASAVSENQLSDLDSAGSPINSDAQTTGSDSSGTEMVSVYEMRKYRNFARRILPTALFGFRLERAASRTAPAQNVRA
jgi:hypothetical protein